MIALDTNVLVRVLLDDDPDQHDAARELLESLSIERPAWIGPIVLVETYWVLTRVRKVSVEMVLSAFRQLLGTPELVCPRGLKEVLDAAAAGADFADAMIDVGARDAHARTVMTFDKRAAQHLGWALLGTSGSR